VIKGKIMHNHELEITVRIKFSTIESVNGRQIQKDLPRYIGSLIRPEYLPEPMAENGGDPVEITYPSVGEIVSTGFRKLNHRER
jgi:hypothetical protein